MYNGGVDKTSVQIERTQSPSRVSGGCIKSRDVVGLPESATSRYSCVTVQKVDHLTEDRKGW